MRVLIVNHDELYSSRRFIEEGRNLGHRVDVVPMKDLRIVVRTGERAVYAPAGDLAASYDVLVMRHFHPHFSEALLVAEAAAAAGLLVIDRALAEGHFVQNKMYEYWKLASAGVPVPATSQAMRLPNALPGLSGAAYPIVAKGVHGSGGRFVFKLDGFADAKRTLTDDVVGSFAFQEYLEVEEEYRVLVIGGRFLAAMRKYGTPGEFRRNVSIGAEGEHADLPAAWIRLCEQAARLLRREFAGVDLAVSGGKPYILEVNRRPGFAGFEKATGVNIARAFIEYVIEDRHRRPA